MSCNARSYPAAKAPTPGPAFPPSKSLFVYPKKVKDESKLYLGRAALELRRNAHNRFDVQYDDRGNPTLTTVTSQGVAGGGSFKKTVQSAYGGGGSREQQFGKVTSSIVTTERLDKTNSSIVHTTTFDYEDVGGFSTPGRAARQSHAGTQEAGTGRGRAHRAAHGVCVR